MATKSCAISIIIITLVLVLHAHTYANTDDVSIGKVVKVADGDTITVLEDRTQHRIRLYGIDAPERRQDFSNRAKQFVSDLVFGKQVRIVKQDIDRYGRIVGIVYVGDMCVNEELGSQKWAGLGVPTLLQDADLCRMVGTGGTSQGWQDGIVVTP